jgi:hypothetical protein
MQSATLRGTALVPTATSDVSRSSTPEDDGDAGDAPGRIDTRSCSAGGRKVVGSNPTAPTDKEPLDLQRFLKRGTSGQLPVGIQFGGLFPTWPWVSGRPDSQLQDLNEGALRVFIPCECSFHAKAAAGQGHYVDKL